ncbi:mechanosensitive ion channel family protein [Candidatus Saccharibacteria bacterium]|nr:mechanosensitive ion channel family protein [Candidatus Saccharibacteria bacterium]
MIANTSSSDLHKLFNNSLVQVVAILLIAYLMQRVSHTFIERLVRRAVKADRFESKIDKIKREDTVIQIARKMVSFVLWATVLLVVLSLLGINLAALATGAGVFGVVFGLGAQNTIKDYLAGFYILTENQYRVGDIVTLSGGTTTQLGTSGVVEEISLRITKLRDLDGTLNIVRNGEAGIITNRTSKYSSVVVDLGVDYKSDIDVVEAVINQVGIDMLADERYTSLITEPIKFLRVEQFTDSGVTVRSLGRVRPASQWEIAGDFRRRVKKALEKADIAMAMQQRMVHTASSHYKTRSNT